MVIVPEQAEVVRQIFVDTLAGKNTHIIAKELNERGITSKKGGKWIPGTVNGIIRNEKFTGDVIFQKTYTDSQFNRHHNYGECNQYLYEGHHEVIVSREVFNATNEVMNQRGREKGNGENTDRYQNRYAFSGKIRCGECGGVFKRRKHYKPSGEYIAWCCTKHIADKYSCSMKFLTDDGIKTAFLTMMNKLTFANQVILKLLLHSLQDFDDKDRLLKIQEYESLLEKNVEISLYFGEEEKKKEKEEGNYKRTIEKAHGQMESREYYQSEDMKWMPSKKDWNGLKSIGLEEKTIYTEEEIKKEYRYYISSLKNDIELFTRAVRGHWSIESMHWYLDVTFKENVNTTKEKQDALNQNIIRKWCLSISKTIEICRPKLSMKKGDLCSV